MASRIETLGLTHAKTADSHYNMGILYRLNFEFRDSLRELTLARNIRAAGNDGKNYSLGVAEVDYSKGQTETLLGFHDQAFVSFYNAAKCRVFRLGAKDMTTVHTLIALEKERHFLRRVDKRLVSLQVKDRLSDLKRQPEGQMNDGLRPAPPGFIQAMFDFYSNMSDHDTLSFPHVRSHIIEHFQEWSNDGSYDHRVVDDMCLLLASLPDWLENALRVTSHLMNDHAPTEIFASKKDEKIAIDMAKQGPHRSLFLQNDSDEKNDVGNNGRRSGRAMTLKPFQMPLDEDDNDDGDDNEDNNSGGNVYFELSKVIIFMYR